MNHDEAECSRCGETYPSTSEATLEHHYLCTGDPTPEEILTAVARMKWISSSLGP